MKILEKGYYISVEPDIYIDSSASGSIRTEHYNFYKFFSDDKFVKGSSQDKNFNFDKKAIQVLNEFDEDAPNLIYTIGTYYNDGHRLFLKFKIFGETNTNSFTILSPETLLDENLKEYKFIEHVNIT